MPGQTARALVATTAIGCCGRMSAFDPLRTSGPTLVCLGTMASSLDQKLIGSWLKVASELGVRVIAPYMMRAPDGSDIECEAYVPDFGSPSGAVVLSGKTERRERARLKSLSASGTPSTPEAHASALRIGNGSGLQEARPAGTDRRALGSATHGRPNQFALGPLPPIADISAVCETFRRGSYSRHRWVHSRLVAERLFV
jgi:hypothetical protein